MVGTTIDRRLNEIISLGFDMGKLLSSFKIEASVSLCAMVLLAGLGNPVGADEILVETRYDGGYAKVKVEGSTPTMEETNRIVRLFESEENPVRFGEIDYDPVFCPWSDYFFPCKPYSTEVYESCLLEELKGISSQLSDIQYYDLKTLAGKKCHRDAER